MEQRHNFRTVIEDSKKKMPKDEINEFYLKGNGYGYLGEEIVYEDGTIITWYLCQIGVDESLIFLYFGDDVFDEFVDSVDADNYKAVYRAWPKLMDALKRGKDDNYSMPALIKLGHTEDREKGIWCLTLKIENVDLTDIGQRFSPYVKGKFLALVNYSFEMLEEMQNNKPSIWPSVISGLIKGLKVLNFMNHLGSFTTSSEIAGWNEVE